MSGLTENDILLSRIVTLTQLQEELLKENLNEKDTLSKYHELGKVLNKKCFEFYVKNNRIECRGPQDPFLVFSSGRYYPDIRAGCDSGTFYEDKIAYVGHVRDELYRIEQTETGRKI